VGYLNTLRRLHPGAFMGAAQNIVSTLLLAGACLAGSPALAEKRVALVIRSPRYPTPPMTQALLPRC
jgi:hypothetical protein